MIKYSNLRAELARHGIKNVQIAALLGVSEKTLRNKMVGITPFGYEEARLIKNEYFPCIDMEVLFEITGTEGKTM